MQVRVNGQVRTLADGTSVAELLDELGMRREGVAVAVDRAVVPRSRHAETVLVEGAEVEVIRAVGGG